MGKTIIEKIFQSHTREEVNAGDIVTLEVDTVMAHDGIAGLVIDLFGQFDQNPSRSDSIVFVADHSSPAPQMGVAEIHRKIRSFTSAQGITHFDVGQGICHQLLMESGRVYPGALIASGESHSCTYGALNAAGLGVGASDIAAVMATGRLWQVVPQTVFVEIRGQLSPEASARDLVFHLISLFKLEFAQLKNFVIEFGGDGLRNLTLAERMSVCNMAIDMGAVTALMPFDKLTDFWTRKFVSAAFEPVYADEDAVYVEKVVINLESIKNMIALPHNSDNVEYLSKVKDVEVDQAVLGTCAAGQIEDYERAAEVIRGRKVKARFLVVTSSRYVYRELIKREILDIFIDAGATILPPGCGPCVGTHLGVVASGETVISTSNRNFRGIMGNFNSNVYLASPEVVAASAVAGKIVRPADLGRQDRKKAREGSGA